MADLPESSTPKTKRPLSRSSTSSNDSMTAIPKKLRQQSPVVINNVDEMSDESSTEEAGENLNTSTARRPSGIDWNEMLDAMTVAMADLNSPFTTQFTNVLNHSEKLSVAYERLDHIETTLAIKEAMIHDMQTDISTLKKKSKKKMMRLWTYVLN